MTLIEAAKLAREALELEDMACRYEKEPTPEHIVKAIAALNQAIAKAEQQEPVAWRNAAIRVGEDLCSVGPFGYYDMTAEQWLDWALSVVTVHAPPPKREWQGLMDAEIDAWIIVGHESLREFVRAIETKLKEKNT